MEEGRTAAYQRSITSVCLRHACASEMKQEQRRGESFPMVILLAEDEFLRTPLYFTMSCACMLTYKKKEAKPTQTER